MTRKSFFALFAALVVLTGGCAAPGQAASPLPSGSPPAAAEVSQAPVPTEIGPEAEVTAQPAMASPVPTSSAPVQTPAAASAAPSQQPEGETGLTCTLWVRCDTILNNMDKLDEDKTELVPEDGVILHKDNLPFEEGESVFDVLLRVTREEKVHMEFVDTPMFHSAYVEGIGNLYEFDCGELSGWSYKVNGTFPSVGCSLYKLKDGDTVEWVYTCDLGRDVGGSNDLGGS